MMIWIASVAFRGINKTSYCSCSQVATASKSNICDTSAFCGVTMCIFLLCLGVWFIWADFSSSSCWFCQNYKEADKLWKDKVDKKHFILQLGKTDGRGLVIENWEFQLLCKAEMVWLAPQEFQAYPSISLTPVQHATNTPQLDVKALFTGGWAHQTLNSQIMCITQYLCTVNAGRNAFYAPCTAKSAKIWGIRARFAFSVALRTA